MNQLGQTRGMATEKQIYNQIVATKNLSKITSSMKMVSAAKLKGDEQRLAAAKPFNLWAYKKNLGYIFTQGMWSPIIGIFIRTLLLTRRI